MSIAQNFTNPQYLKDIVSERRDNWKNIFINILINLMNAATIGVYVNVFSNQVDENNLGIIDSIRNLQWWNVLFFLFLFFLYWDLKIGPFRKNALFLRKDEIINGLCEVISGLYKSNNPKVNIMRTLIMVYDHKTDSLGSAYSYKSYSHSKESVELHKLDTLIAGEAIKNNEIICADITQEMRYQNIWKDLKSLTAAPMFAPNFNHKSPKPIGVLILDCDVNLKDSGFKSSECKIITRKLADIFASLISI